MTTTASPPRETAQEAWRKSVVGREIEIEFGDDFYAARIQSYRLGLFSALYLADGSVERMHLSPDFTGSDPNEEESFVWRFAAAASAGTAVAQASNNNPSSDASSSIVEALASKRARLEEQELEAWRQSLVGTDVEICFPPPSSSTTTTTTTTTKDWIDCHVDKVEPGTNVFTLFVVEDERRERYKLARDLSCQRVVEEATSSAEAGGGPLLVGEWRAQPKRKMTAEDKLWRESIVNRVISLPSGGELEEQVWLEANVEEDLKTNDLFLIRYLATTTASAPPSYERVMLFPNMRGADPSGDEEFEWRLLDDRVADDDDDDEAQDTARSRRGHKNHHTSRVLDDTTFPRRMLHQLVWVEFGREWYEARIVHSTTAGKKKTKTTTTTNKPPETGGAGAGGVVRADVTLEYTVDKSRERVTLLSDFTGVPLATATTDDKAPPPDQQQQHQQQRFKWKM